MSKIKKIKIVDFMKTETESKRKLHPAGYLILPDCQIARSGILQYGDVMCDDGSVVNDGEVINVYRPPEALRECIKQFNGIPLSVQHPKESSVDPETVRDVIVGTIGSNAKIVKIDGGEVAVVADIMVYDKDAIDIIQSNKMTELSAGYETAYRQQRGKTEGGEAYDAVQYYLMPNHVALVEEGRCGSDCKVCDSGINNKEMVTMKIKKSVKKATNKYRYFIAAGDSKDGKSIEISKQAFDELAKEEDAEIEELEEDEVEIEENESASPLEAKRDAEGEEEASAEGETAEEEAKENSSEETDEDEESMGDEDKEAESEVKEDEGEDSEIFEVELDDGTIGKMDKVAYEYMKRFVEMQKKGDSMTPAEIMKLAAVGGRVLGEKFAIDGYVTADGKFDSRKLKQDVIRKNMPGVVVKSLKNDEALDSMFDCAMKSAAKNKSSWAADMLNLANVPKATDEAESPVEKARLARLNKINRKEIK